MERRAKGCEERGRERGREGGVERCAVLPESVFHKDEQNRNVLGDSDSALPRRQRDEERERERERVRERDRERERER